MDVLIIAHFITEFEKNGTSRFVYIAERLSESHNVEIVTSRFDHISKTQRGEQTYDLKTTITLLDEPSYKRNVCIQRFISHKRFGSQVKKYLNTRKKPDVIYCAVPSLDCADYAAKYAKKNNVKFIVDIQDLWPEAFKMVFNVPVISNIVFSPMKRKANRIYASADTIVGVSETYCNAAAQANAKGAKGIPVFLGTKLDCFDKYVLENKVEKSDDKFVIGYCGTLGHSYDIKCVMDAMLYLKRKGHDRISFWVMGDGPLKESFEKYAADNNLDVKFFGRVRYEQMCGLLSACDVCVNPIVATSAASVINKHGDYAASGIPVINTQPSQEYRMMVEKYGCGINCESSNSTEVAQAMLCLLNDNEKKTEMGKQARKMAEDLFDRNNSYLKILHLFKRNDL